MSEIRTKPSNKKYRDGFDRIFRKRNNTPNASSRFHLDKSAPLGVTSNKNIVSGKINVLPLNPYMDDSGNLDCDKFLREFKTTVCVNNDPHFGG